MSCAASPLAQAILVALARADNRRTGPGVSLPRLCKQLGQGASVLLRELSMMGNAAFAGHTGPGWVQVEQCDGRWLVHLTDAGRAALPIGGEPTEDGAIEMNAFAALEAVAQRSVRVFGEPGVPMAGEVRADALATELPVALVFNGISHAVMMATPEHLEDFALGFALSEGIIDSVEDCRGTAVHRAGEAAQLPHGVTGLEVHMDVSARSFARLKGRRRSLAGRTGCGVCGVESLAALDMEPAPVPSRAWAQHVDLKAVLAAFDALTAQQPHNAQTGSLHAAGWAVLGEHGSGGGAGGFVALAGVSEDIGRHNALDKLIGWLARNGRLAEPGFVILSSRGSHELVRKCARVGIAALATISAPTDTGVLLAERAGVRLWGLCRAPRGVLYAP